MKIITTDTVHRAILHSLDYFGPLTAEGINDKLSARGITISIMAVDTHLANLVADGFIRKSRNADASITFTTAGP